MIGSHDRDPGSLGEPATDAPLAPPAGATGASPLAGQVLGGRYQIRAVLGRGGMAEVYRAPDTRLRRDEGETTVSL